jgi:hypothetical protein
MRKLLVAGLAAVIVFSLAGVAYAVNQYEVIAGGSNVSGTPAKPASGRIQFGFEVSDSDGLRPTPIQNYRIASEGLVTFPRAFPSCTFAQASGEVLNRACNKAKVGSGIVRNHVGSPSDRNSRLICNLQLTLINVTGPGISRSRGGVAIRLDGDTKTITDPNSREIGCVTAIHEAIKAPFFNVRIDGRPSSELRFTVPPDLLHPSGLDNAVVETNTIVGSKKRSTRIRGKNRRVSFYSSVGCKGRQRAVRVTFIDEQGRTSRETKQTNTCGRR